MVHGRRLFLAFAALLFVSGVAQALDLPQKQNLYFPFVPDSARTTGSLCNESDPDYRTNRYPERIAYCVRHVTNSRKSRIFEAYGVPAKCRKHYTIDHFIPLSLGGTNNEDNLWPEAKNIKALRYNLELELFEKLSDGKITQAHAVATIREAKLNPPVEDTNAFEFCD